MVNYLKLQIPWMTLTSSPIIITIDSLDLHAVLIDVIDFSKNSSSIGTDLFILYIFFYFKYFFINYGIGILKNNYSNKRIKKNYRNGPKKQRKRKKGIKQRKK